MNRFEKKKEKRGKRGGQRARGFSARNDRQSRRESSESFQSRVPFKHRAFFTMSGTITHRVRSPPFFIFFTIFLLVKKKRKHIPSWRFFRLLR